MMHLMDMNAVFESTRHGMKLQPLPRLKHQFMQVSEWTNLQEPTTKTKTENKKLKLSPKSLFTMHFVKNYQKKNLIVMFTLNFQTTFLFIYL